MILFMILMYFIIPSQADECIIETSTFICPTQGLPSYYTLCCLDEANNNSTVQCCPSLGPKMFNVNSSLIMIISISVMISCLVLSAVIIVCCFWSPCPLFDTCRVNYGRRLNIAYTKEEEALNLPPEDDNNCNHYSPIVIKPIDSDV